MLHKSQNKTLLSCSIIFLILHLCIFTCESRPPFACDPSNVATQSLPFCKTSLPIVDRVNDLIRRMTLQEKIKNLVSTAAPIGRLGIMGYEWWNEALHGLSDTGHGVKFRGPFPGATSFPQVITTAASFNSSLWQAIGEVVSTEGRAMYNGGLAGLTYWSPNVNIFRDPRWGRGQETPGEDPGLASRYGVSFVRGLQGDGVGNKLKVAACCKHYTAYDIENWNHVDRFHFNAKVSKQDLEETYNIPFKGCVLDGKVASVMCSYNQVNDKPTCADPSLLNGIIRGQWRLNGYIVSDCDSVRVMHEKQHFTRTPEDAVAQSIKAGLDLDCGSYLATFTEGAVRGGKLNEADINRAIFNLLAVQMRLGMFDGPGTPYANLGPRDVCTPAHQQLALEAARQGIVLLQNRNRTLPLSTSRHRTVAVIGPNSDNPTTMLGNYAGKPCASTTPLQGISRYARTIHQEGCVGIFCPNNRQFGVAENAARQADATILVMGLDQSIEKEGLDRTGLLLPGLQQELVSRVAMASRGPVILVIMSGGPIDVTFAKNDPKISGILWVGYPGQAGGTAIANVIFGTTNPGGKLPMTWYPQDYVTKVSMFDMAMHANPSRGYPGRTYRFYKGPVVFPFGYGLSYTGIRHTLVKGPSTIPVKFTGPKAFKNTTTLIDAVRVSHANCDNLSLRLNVEVENIGDMDGTHTVMVFSSNPNTGDKQLITFEKVHLLAGTKQTVPIEVDACKHLSVVDKYGIRRMLIGTHHLHIGDELKHRITFQNVMEEIKS